MNTGAYGIDGGATVVPVVGLAEVGLASAMVWGLRRHRYRPVLLAGTASTRCTPQVASRSPCSDSGGGCGSALPAIPSF